jgi:hypothetical protein
MHHKTESHFLAVPNLARSCSAGPCPVSQSTYYTVTSACNPAHANDDNFNSFVCTCMGGGYCGDNDPWVRIDLQRPQTISSGVVTTRGGGPSRLDNFKIWVGNGSDIYNADGNSLCYTASTFQHWNAPFKHEFSCVAYARYVFLQPTVILSSVGDSNPNADFVELQIFNVSVFEGWLSTRHCLIIYVEKTPVLVM